MAIQFDVDAALAKLGALVQTHGQQALDTAVAVERVSSLDALLGGLGWLLVALTVAYVGLWCWRRHLKVSRDRYDFPIWAASSITAWVVAGFIGALGFVCPWLTLWNWVGVFDPKLALAHDLLVRLAGVAA